MPEQEISSTILQEIPLELKQRTITIQIPITIQLLEVITTPLLELLPTAQQEVITTIPTRHRELQILITIIVVEPVEELIAAEADLQAVDDKKIIYKIPMFDQ